MTTLRIPLSVPGVTEAEVPADARVVGVERASHATSHNRWDGSTVTSLGHVLVLDVPESPQVRLERRRWHVHSNREPVPAAPWLFVHEIDDRWLVWEERLPSVPTAVKATDMTGAFEGGPDSVEWLRLQRDREQP